MLTLSQATADSRRFLKILVLFIGGLLSIIIIVRGLVAIKEIISPTPAPPPTVSFGKLPKIGFPANITNKKLDYQIDTLTGSLPNLPDRAVIYKTIGYSPNILAVDEANAKASSVGFNTKGAPLSERNYRWEDSSSLQRQLTMDINTNDFVFSSLFLNDPNVLGSKNVPTNSQAISSAQSFIDSMGLLYPDIDQSKTQTFIYRIDHGALVPATSFSNTQVVGVYFRQADIGGIPIYYPNANNSTMGVLVSSGDFEPTVMGADFSHQNISSTSATYPIKTASEAYDDLKKGNAYISSYSGGSKITIKEVFLAYYMSDQKQDYLMPIVVFKGEGFFAYVSAIRDEWINN